MGMKVIVASVCIEVANVRRLLMPMCVIMPRRGGILVMMRHQSMHLHH